MKDPCDDEYFHFCPKCKTCSCLYYREEGIWICHNEECQEVFDEMEYHELYEKVVA